MEYLSRNFKYFRMIYPEISIEKFKKFQINTSILFFITSLIVSMIYLDVLTAISISLVILCIIYFLISSYPYYLRLNIIAKLESELPYFLIDLDVKLGLSMPIHEALENSSKDYEVINKIFTKVVNQNKRGIPFYKIFLDIGTQYDSDDLKRALNQITVAYESGYRNSESSPLFNLAQEILSKQKNQIRLYNSKLVMISLLFIAVTALLPSLFLIFVTIGSSIIDIGFSKTQILLIFVVLFPIIDLILIFAVNSITPQMLKRS